MIKVIGVFVIMVLISIAIIGLLLVIGYAIGRGIAVGIRDECKSENIVMTIKREGMSK